MRRLKARAVGLHPQRLQRPSLALLVALLGWWLDQSMPEQGLVAQIGTIVGEQGAAVIRQALASAQEPGQWLLASLLGFFVLLFGAAGVFGELQSALQRLWTHGHEGMPHQPWRHGASLRLRLRGVAYLLAFGFLRLVSLVISTLLNLFAGWAGQRLAVAPLLRVLNEVTAWASVPPFLWA